MSSTLTPHPDHEALLRLLDDDLSPEERRLVNDHLGGCRPCRRDLEEVREAIGDYLQFHQVVLKKAYPSPPKPWDRLDALAAGIPERAPRPRASLFTFVRRPWLAAAAAVAAVFFIVRLLERPPAVKAAELLRKAASAEKAAAAPVRSIRIRSRKFKWDRPGRLAAGSGGTSADASGIRKLLESAGYSWEDPLSAGAYLRWHDGLAEKQDRVEGAAPAVVIRTTTAASPISDASLTLRPDLRAVACTLRFGETDTVEMTEIPDTEPSLPVSIPRAATPEIQPPPPAVAAPPAGPGDELQVIAALHGIGADLGEPIDVRREGPNVLVNVTGLDARRQSEVKAALAGLATVRLQFGELERRGSPEEPRRPAPQVDTANPLLSELQAVSPNNVTTADLADRLMDDTEKIIERVYALRGLARRFPADTTARMTEAEAGSLHAILRDHAGPIATSTAAIERLLQPILPPAGPAPTRPENNWQDVALGMLDDARRLDQALNGAAAADVSGERKLRASRALADLDRRLIRLRALIQP